MSNCHKIDISLWLSITCILTVATKRRHDEGRDIGGYAKRRQICCVTLSKNKYTAMKKDKTNEGTDKRKMSKLEKENAQLKAQNEQLKSDNKQLRSELGRERKKKT